MVMAYHSESELKASYLIQPFPQDHKREDALTLFIGQRLAVPEEEDADRALEKAIELAKQEDFQERWSQSRHWQIIPAQQALARNVWGTKYH